MNKETIETLGQFLSDEHGSTSFQKNGMPEELLDSNLVTEELRAPTKCPIKDDCEDFCSTTEDGQKILIECDDGHNDEYPKSDYKYYELSFKKILEKICGVVDEEMNTYDDSHLPSYTKAKTNSNINIYFVISPHVFENAINKVCVDTLAEESPALLIVPNKNIKNILNQKAVFSSSNMIYSITFSLLTNHEEIKNSLSTIKNIRSVERKFLDRLDDENRIVRRVNSNPRYILTELNHMRLLRLAKEIPGSSGTRLEKVAESAFSHLYTTQIGRGGEDNRGDRVPDSVFFISSNNLPENYDSILGVADTKSGSDAGFRDEPVDGKHDEYVKEARAQSVAAEKIAHTFIVLDFDGHQDIDFYDRMKKIYNKNEYLVIFTAEALAMVLSAYLTHTVSNELSLVHGSFQSVIYPLFDPEKFNSEELSLGKITREVGRKQEEYEEKYKQRPDMMVVVPEVVEKLFEKYAESPSEIENIFDNYYTPSPII